MIIEVDKFVQKIIDWLREQKKQANKQIFVVPSNEAPVHQVVVKLCQEAGSTVLPEVQLPISTSRMAWSVKTADLKNGLIVGTLIREEVFARSYHKYMDAADIYPLADLYYSEIVQLYQALGLGDLDKEEPSFRGILASMIQWVDQENERTSIVSLEELPNTSRVWFRYTIPQKEAIFKLHQFEKTTRHKHLERPKFSARYSEFVRR